MKDLVKMNYRSLQMCAVISKRLITFSLCDLKVRLFMLTGDSSVDVSIFSFLCKIRWILL